MTNNTQNIEPDADNVLNAGNNSISAKIGYTPTSTEKAQLALAVYEDGALKAVKVSSPDITFKAGEETILEADVDVLTDADSNKSVKVFLWKDGTLLPMFRGFTLE